MIVLCPVDASYGVTDATPTLKDDS